ncbi:MULTISPECIES: glycerophosphodiester phosphodiesterase [Pontibacter]|uniref:Glycerophosphoryl diester phosphodiesterase n=1 Tax=Pontibacter lucknowensis TaxID=1077936 RepID=A0A1N6X805_9BACT|nr:MULTISPECIES: glycerophosphodiester phosphodiesterase [Pontibacter]EJF09433.1 glycerophosphoryl diester phosphodiesterase [Pontibacter sp. BAB1700]SIQ98371.1 glycerophosphoryl diester phosphodiesterase [Pontibacter lucknowensis]
MHRNLLFASFLYLISSCTMSAQHGAIPDTTTRHLPAFDLEGHRGARGLMPENTIPAMIRALDLGVTTLEMDVHITKDKQVVLSHDPYINPEHDLLSDGSEIPAANKRRYVLYQMDYAAIKTFDAGTKFYDKFPQQEKLPTYKPLLSDLIDSVQTYLQQQELPQVYYNIETKSKPGGDGKLHPAPEEFVELLMGVIEAKGMSEWVIIQSFDVRTLQVLQRRYPHIKTSLLVENLKGLNKNLETLGFIPDIYSPYYKLITPGLIRNCHAKGMKVIPWTINEKNEMQRLKEMGVDGLISDYPNLYREL